MKLSAANAGATAAVQGKPYSANPYDRARQKDLHLAWSQGHNGMRARMLDDKDEGLVR